MSAAILERPLIEKILTHLGLDPQPLSAFGVKPSLSSVELARRRNPPPVFVAAL